MNDRARWNSPVRCRCVRSPEITTTSYCRSWISASIASYCSGTAGAPKCRSEQWKTVVTRIARGKEVSQFGDDRVRELVGAGGPAEIAGHRLSFLDRRLE